MSSTFVYSKYVKNAHPMAILFFNTLWRGLPRSILINKIYKDECTGISRDNYVGILAIVMVLVHPYYRCYYIFCGCTNGGKNSIFCWHLSNSDGLSSSMHVLYVVTSSVAIMEVRNSIFCGK
jgi:hypothetical protein